jgi:hypothetical protein
MVQTPMLSPPPQQMPPQNQFKPLQNLPPSLIDPCAVGKLAFFRNLEQVFISIG